MLGFKKTLQITMALRRIVPEESLRRPLTPENFPSVFTHATAEQLRQMPSVGYADLIPKRFYLFVGEIGNVDIHYICKNYPRIREFVYKVPYNRAGGRGPNGWVDSNRWEEEGEGVTLRLGYDELGAGSRWIDLAVGFDDANGRVQLNPDSVELLECDREPGPRERYVRGLFAGRKTQRKRRRSTRRKKTRKHIR